MTGPSIWPGLGFDPAPGDAAAVDGLTSRLINASRTLLGASDTFDSLQAAPRGWQGDAAEAFSMKVGELPEHLGNAHRSLDKVTSELRRWQTTLEQLRTKARDLEVRAVAARRQVAEAGSAATIARAAPDLSLAGRHFDTDAELAEAQSRLNGALVAVNDADRRLRAATSNLEQLIAGGRRLLADHRAGADSVAAAVRGATDGLAPPEPGWLDSAGDWMDENPGEAGDVAGVVSAVAGALALIPVLTPLMAPLAMISGAVALVAHGVDISEKGSWADPSSWVTLFADGLGMVPAVGALSRSTGAGMEAARVAGGALTSAGGATDLAAAPMSRAAEEFGRVLYAEGLQPDAAQVFQRLGEATAQRWGGDAWLIGKVEQGTVNVGLQAPTVDGWLHPSGEGAHFTTPAGLAGLAVNTAQTELVDPDGSLVGGLGRFARAVG